jgi:hypothetical protein
VFVCFTLLHATLLTQQHAVASKLHFGATNTLSTSVSRASSHVSLGTWSRAAQQLRKPKYYFEQSVVFTAAALLVADMYTAYQGV